MTVSRIKPSSEAQLSRRIVPPRRVVLISVIPDEILLPAACAAHCANYPGQPLSC